MLTLATIPRVTTVPETMAALDADLAERAREQLGYTPGMADINRGKREQKLISALLEHGVRPFTTDGVERYKRQMLAKKWRTACAWQLAFAVVAAACIVHVNNGLYAAGGVLVVTIGSGAIWTVLQPVNWEWSEVGISNYRGVIPQHVLATALLLKHELSNLKTDKGFSYGVTLSVEELRLTERVIFDPDPFLKVTIQASNGSPASAYVAAWDEPSFTGKMY